MVHRRLIGFYGVLVVFREWVRFLFGGSESWELPNVAWFWEALTEEMEAQTWRSPWGMFSSANFAGEIVDRYEGWEVKDIYALFCDEDRYAQFLEESEGFAGF